MNIAAPRPFPAERATIELSLNIFLKPVEKSIEPFPVQIRCRRESPFHLFSQTGKGAKHPEHLGTQFVFLIGGVGLRKKLPHGFQLCL